jgi:hypothetical protein
MDERDFRRSMPTREVDIARAAARRLDESAITTEAVWAIVKPHIERSACLAGVFRDRSGEWAGHPEGVKINDPANPIWANEHPRA